MDLATLLGIVSAFGLVIIAMSIGGGLGAFINLPSVMIVVGGTLGATLINYPLSDILGVVRVARNAFFSKKVRVGKIIEMLVDMSKISRREGILGLENTLKDIKDPFFIKGMTLMIDGIEPGSLSELLNTEIDYTEERHRLGAEVFTTMGNFAPAMGMTGTLIGLVKMLMNMSDPSSIGPSMAVALITTFYGVILSNLIFLPIAGKLKTRSAQELTIKQLIMTGILSIQSGDNPRMLEQKLHSFVPPNERKSSFDK